MKLSAPFFLSYAHKDEADVKRFREVFEDCLNSSAEFAFGAWTDHLILPGQHWRVEINAALDTAKFGLLLISPAFLSSPFITSQELPLLLAKPMVVPAALHKILPAGGFDLKGLEERQIFHDSKGRTFDGCGRMTGRRDFARELFVKIIALLKKHAS